MLGASVGAHAVDDEAARHLAHWEQLHPEPRAGYILLLLDGSEQSHKWLEDNVVALDSISGREVAVSVVHASEDSERGEPVMKALVDRRTGMCERLCRFSIRYGSDAMARNLGILAEVPCIVLRGANPFEAPTVLRIDPHQLSYFSQVLRSSIDELVGAPGYAEMAVLLGRLHRVRTGKKDVRNRLRGKCEEDRALEDQLSAAAKLPPSEVAKSLEALVGVISWNVGDLRCCQAMLAELSRLRKLITKLQGSLKGQNKSTKRYKSRLQKRWRYGEIHGLITIGVSRRGPSSAEVERAISEMLRRQNQLHAEIVRLGLPHVIHQLQERRAGISRELESLNWEIGLLDGEEKLLMLQLSNPAILSYSAIFTKEATKLQRGPAWTLSESLMLHLDKYLPVLVRIIGWGFT